MLTSFEVASIVFAVLAACALAGTALGRVLPEHHLSQETRTSVSVSMAIVGTMSALVISLLLSNAGATYVARNEALARFSADLVRLDGICRLYGGDAEPIRGAIRAYAVEKDAKLFSEHAPGRPGEVERLLEQVEEQLLTLDATDMWHRWLAEQALQRSANLRDAAWTLALEQRSNFPWPFVGGVAMWLGIVFGSFGLFAPRNLTAMLALGLCAFAVAGAFKMTLDMDSPFAGPVRMSGLPIRISHSPMREAIAAISKP